MPDGRSDDLCGYESRGKHIYDRYFLRRYRRFLSAGYQRFRGDSHYPDTSGSQENAGDGQSGSAEIMPVQGEIIKPYSGDSLLYSETLDQYICHKAIDIQAPAGSPVCAVMAGTVTEVGKDDRYGSYVLISHGNGLESRYCSLGDIKAAEGDVVKKGDTIGGVGEDALFEKAEGTHLHFEVTKDGELTNPDVITQQ